MKKNFNFMFTLLLTLLAFVFGVDMSMAVAADVPQSPVPDDDTKSKKTDLTGTPATEAIVKDSDINDDEIDNLVVRFCPFNYTLTTDIESVPIQKRSTDYEISHAVLATPQMDCVMKGAYSEVTNSDVAVFGVSHIDSAYWRMFGLSQTVLVKGVDGYTQDGSSQVVKGDLVLKVVKRESTQITLIPINGKWSSVNNLYYVPSIPAGTSLAMMATAGHTAQIIVSPKNQQPVLESAYLQKKIMNTTVEKEWKEKKKKIPFFTDDLENNALLTFRQENERTKLMGVKNLLKEEDKDLGEVNCYYEEGILNQLLMKYCTTGQLTYQDLMNMQKMQFGKWSQNNVAEVYCSIGFMVQLQNLDFTRVAQTNIETETTTLGTNVTKFKTPLGTFNFKMCQILDECGYENCAFIVDMKNAIHYWKPSNIKEKSQEDMSKGGDNPVEADRNRYIKIDCVCLRGYNSILVGPASIIYNMPTEYSNKTVYDFVASGPVSTTTTYFTLKTGQTAAAGTKADPKSIWGITIDGASAAWPAAPADGMLVYLKDDEPFTGYTAGTLIRYSSCDEDWHKYSGELTA